jgi:hypothetical protein
MPFLVDLDLSFMLFLITCNHIRLVIKWHFWCSFFLLAFTFLRTKLTLLSSLYQISFLCIKWKVLYIISIPFLFTSQKLCQSFKSWLIFSTPKAPNCSRMWKLDGSTCFFKEEKNIEYHQLIVKMHVETWKYEK